MTKNHKHEHDHSENSENSENFITIIDEEGNQELHEILFTFESEDFDKSYVLVFPAGSSEEEEVELSAFSYRESDGGLEGTLSSIETEEEWDMVEEVLNTFIEDEELN